MKNWRITTKLHFENLSLFFKKNERTHILAPSLCSFLFAFQFCSHPVHSLLSAKDEQKRNIQQQHGLLN